MRLRSKRLRADDDDDLDDLTRSVRSLRLQRRTPPVLPTVLGQLVRWWREQLGDPPCLRWLVELDADDPSLVVLHRPSSSACMYTIRFTEPPYAAAYLSDAPHARNVTQDALFLDSPLFRASPSPFLAQDHALTAREILSLLAEAYTDAESASHP